MTLKIFDGLVQGTEEWLDARRGMLTASEVGKFITPKTLKVASNDTSRGLTGQLVAERITGWSDPTFVSDDMLRGTLHEPHARAAYAASFAPVEEVGFMVSDALGHDLGYSPDGLVGDEGLIEIKCPRAKNHLAVILADKVPDYHMAQLQTGLLVSGREWIDYVSFCAGMPLYVKRVEADPRWANVIAEALKTFEANASEMVAKYTAAVAGMPTTERIEYDEIAI